MHHARLKPCCCCGCSRSALGIAGQHAAPHPLPVQLCYGMSSFWPQRVCDCYVACQLPIDGHLADSCACMLPSVLRQP